MSDRRSGLFQMLMLIAGGLLLALVLRGILGDRWFSHYGAATVALCVLPAIGRLIWRGLAVHGMRRWPAIAVILPAAVAAIIQITFWTGFFASPAAGIKLGMVRGLFQTHVGPFLPLAAGLYAVVLGWVAWRALGPAAITGRRAAP